MNGREKLALVVLLVLAFAWFEREQIHDFADGIQTGMAMNKAEHDRVRQP
jgi:hypothetical protein